MQLVDQKRCIEPHCEKEVEILARSICRKHYARHIRLGDLDAFAPITYNFIVCEWCGITVKTFRGARYCPQQCADRAANALIHPRLYNACLECGKSLAGKPSNSMYCSDEKCGTLFRNRSKAAERLANKGSCKFCDTQLPKHKRVYCSEPCKRFARRAVEFGLTIPQLRTLLEEHPVCDICETNDWGVHGPHIDHDRAHCPDSGSCGKCIRGILCVNCNILIAHAHDDIGVLQRSISYLSRGSYISFTS